MHEYAIVDAFTTAPLSGNPVAVFFEADDIDAETMQRLARETNLSETTFVMSPHDDGDHRVRIFTPVNELPFAGHPLLGTAIALAHRDPTRQLRLETKQATIPVTLDALHGHTGYAQMHQPIPTWESYHHRDVVIDALGLEGSTLPVTAYRNGPRHVFVGMSSAQLRALRPDQRALASLTDVAINCFAAHGSGWRARMFSPAYGVVEDPATGSAAGPLAVHLARHGVAPYGTTLEIQQGVEIGRPSTMYATALGDADDICAVSVGGWAVAVAEGTFRSTAASVPTRRDSTNPRERAPCGG